jgi:hypothetical protein
MLQKPPRPVSALCELQMSLGQVHQQTPHLEQRRRLMVALMPDTTRLQHGEAELHDEEQTETQDDPRLIGWVRVHHHCVGRAYRTMKLRQGGKSMF